MTYTLQDLHDYAVANGTTLDMVEALEAFNKYPNDIMDAFDYALGVPEECLGE